MKYFIPIIILSFVLLSCSKDENEETTNTNNSLTCTGTSSGSGPTIGSVALEEATYLSACFQSRKIQLEFKNSTEAQYTSYTYGDSSCSGTATDTTSLCMNTITVSSTAVTKPTYVGGTTGDNVTGYNAVAEWKNGADTSYLQFGADNASVFWFNQASTEAERDSNSVWIFKFTKQ
jgi:hypothetical protein